MTSITNEQTELMKQEPIRTRQANPRKQLKVKFTLKLFLFDYHENKSQRTVNCVIRLLSMQGNHPVEHYNNLVLMS